MAARGQHKGLGSMCYAARRIPTTKFPEGRYSAHFGCTAGWLTALQGPARACPQMGASGPSRVQLMCSVQAQPVHGIGTHLPALWVRGVACHPIYIPLTRLSYAFWPKKRASAEHIAMAGLMIALIPLQLLLETFK